MSRYCLDTSAYSHFQRGGERVTELVDQAEWVGVPTVTLGELKAGEVPGSLLTQSRLREQRSAKAVHVR